ncbi:hypothetical protein [Paraburkholderia tagetis]|uniref:Uncharacterized protein n=1 Tax=Paraburkholderia tagetis TaxID=2913261 RepID=A0A9X1UDW5_9BURK|nr:hypothetical protein [Paraburkholderia tagetis]MCG5073044.1 hypothetical protein [Paraburkholderia tagetis]
MRKNTTATVDAMNAEIDRIGYALAKQVPAMERGFTIQTSYGDLHIDAEDAPRFVALAHSILQKQLKRAEVQHG